MVFVDVKIELKICLFFDIKDTDLLFVHKLRNNDFCHLLYIGSGGEVGGSLVGLVDLEVLLLVHPCLRVGARELVALHSGQPDHHH